VKTRYPESAADWADSYSAQLPGVGLSCQDDEGSDQAEDWTGGERHFDAISSVVFGVDGESGRKAIQLGATSARLVCSDDVFMDPGAGPCAAWARVKIPSETAFRMLFGQNGADPRWYAQAHGTSEVINILVDDGPFSRQVGVGSLPDHVGAWIDVITRIDPDSGRLHIDTSFGRNTITYGNVTPADLSPIHALSIGGNTQTPIGYEVGYFAAWNQDQPALTDAQVAEILNAPLDVETAHPFWTTIEDAIHAWVVRGTGLAEAKVIWAGQNSPRPEGTHATLKIVAVNRNGPDWSDTVEDGDDVTFHSRGPREIVLSIQCFDGAATGALNSAARLDKTLALAALPTQQAAFQAAGVGYLRSGSVKHMGGVMGSVFEPRAQVGVTLSMFSDVSEPGSLIEFVEIENDGASIYVPSNPLA
jgi:hypothetical protein